MFGFTKKFIIAIAMVSAMFVLAAGPAGAIEPEFENPGVEPDPEPPVLITGIIAVPVQPSASVEISCTSESGTARVENPTANFQSITVRVNGDIVGSDNVVPQGAYLVDFPIVENETVTVEIRNGESVMLSDDFTRDCLLPDPSYQIIHSCEGGQAHARLINNGDDVARMAVSYEGAPYALESVAPHSSRDWLLAVDPGETVDFTVKFGHDVDLGTESFTFDCPEEPIVIVEPPVEPPVTPTPPAPTGPPATTIPAPATPDTVAPVQQPVVTEEIIGEATNESEGSAAATDLETGDVDGEEGNEETDEETLALGNDDETSGNGLVSSLNMMVVGGFSLLLLLILAAAKLLSRRDQLVTA